jgi:hypothetical protein
MTAPRMTGVTNENATTAKPLEGVDIHALTTAIRALLSREVRNIIYTHVLDEPIMSEVHDTAFRKATTPPNIFPVNSRSSFLRSRAATRLDIFGKSQPYSLRSNAITAPLKVCSPVSSSAWPTVSSTVLFGVLAVLYGPMGSSVRTVVLVKESSTVRSSSTAARALY